MAIQTDTRLRNLVIYNIFVRNFTPEGTFKAVIPELDRIKAMGVDMIWLLPMYPIGQAQRKGQDGSPYAIQDYRAIDPNYGSMEDFLELVEAIHQRDMKIMIDIVFNHTSPDSWLAVNHPEWFYHKPDGSFGNRVGDWYDIIDLDYDHRDLWEYQIETLKFWAQYVDGFRCDVAPLVPLEFWQQARQEVETVNSDMVWLSESVHPSFISFLRGQGLVALSDSEIYQVFDMSYEYDIRDEFEGYIQGEIPLQDYVKVINRQETMYPNNYIKLRNLENHDNPRIRHYIHNEDQLKQWMVFSYSLKGAQLIYNGQEMQADHAPSLFDKDLIMWDDQLDLSHYFQQLITFKKSHIPTDGQMQLFAQNHGNLVLIHHKNPEKEVFVGVQLKSGQGQIHVDLADGDYTDLLSQKLIQVRQGMVNAEQTPFAIETNRPKKENI